MAEAHPVGFRWVMKAKEKGATIIHVDPRFSRTSAMADLWVPIRSGSDIAFLGGLIHHVIETNKYFREYVVHYTNASNVIRPDFRDTEQGAGFFSGWDPEGQFYNHESWAFEDGEDSAKPRRDPTLEHPRCVFQTLKRHYARYTPEMVERVCGIPPELFLKVADALTKNSTPERTTAFCYAVGWTHQSKGAQIIRAAAVLQLLLGNIGRPGGGIMALRGHASIQGSTDIPTLYDTLPGYLSMPSAPSGEQNDLAGYLKKYTQETGLWHDTPKYMVSLLKAYYGQRATRENDFGYGWLPKLTKRPFAFRVRHDDGRPRDRRLFRHGPKSGGRLAERPPPAAGARPVQVARRARPGRNRNRVFLVRRARNRAWRDEDRGHRHGGFPLARRLAHRERRARSPTPNVSSNGAKRPSRRPAIAAARPWFIHQLAKRLIARAQSLERSRWTSRCARSDWWYPENEEGEAEAEAVLAEINGWHVPPEAEIRLRSPRRGPCPRQGQATRTTASSLTITSPSRTTAAPPPVAGFTPAATAATRSTSATSASRTASTATAGVSRGPATAASSTTAPARPLTGSPGASARKLVWWDEEKRQVDRRRRARLPEK